MKVKTAAVSGGFDPIHVGHIRLLRETSALGDYVVVILARDDQLLQKKGFVFMPYTERKEILESIYWVDEVLQNIDKDDVDLQSLREYRPDVFCQGGDRVPGNIVQEEVDVCKEIGCKIVYKVGGKKVQSSSELVRKCKQV